MKITNHIERMDICIVDKLDNMYGSEIMEDVFNKCMEEETMEKIEEEVWCLLNNPNSPFSKTDFYKGLSYTDYMEDNVYNCDALYVCAIENVLDISLHSGLNSCRK